MTSTANHQSSEAKPVRLRSPQKNISNNEHPKASRGQFSMERFGCNRDRLPKFLDAMMELHNQWLAKVEQAGIGLQYQELADSCLPSDPEHSTLNWRFIL